MSSVEIDDSGALRDEVCLMHWSGPNKPWNKGHEDKIHSEFWAVYGTPKADEAMEESSENDENK
jgi:lipopolysaccharide biosynthesis glycosyltransferase